MSLIDHVKSEIIKQFITINHKVQEAQELRNYDRGLVLPDEVDWAQSSVRINEIADLQEKADFCFESDIRNNLLAQFSEKYHGLTEAEKLALNREIRTRRDIVLNIWGA